MAIFVVSYDLNKKKDYPSLFEAIKKLGTWCHVLDSTWLVASDSSAKLIADYLLKYMDEDDEVFVSKLVKREAAWRLKDPAKLKWLQANI